MAEWATRPIAPWPPERKGGGMRSRLAVVLATVAASFAAGTAAPAQPLVPAALAKTCSAGFTHAVIGGVHKCLRAGEFCARRYDAQYRRYGYRCVRPDARGNYHLTHG